MGVITTFKEPLTENKGANKSDKTSFDIQSLVNSITLDILRESPQIVAEVENGSMNRNVLEKAVIKSLDKQSYHAELSREQVISKVFNYMFGYGVLHELLEDEDITDIDITKYNEGTITKNGKRQKLDISFGNEKLLESYCKLIAIRNGGILNENDSHCRVADEKRRLRINVSIRTRNITGPAISIRKHRMKSYTMEELVKLGMMSEEMAELTKQIAKSNASIIFCGKGGSGKTTLFRAVINNMPELDRVLVVESDSELYPDKPNCIVQRTKKKNEGGTKVTLEDLAKDGLTMSLDTYCIGEIVGDECWEFIRAGFTGHRVCSTLHSGDAEDAFVRMLSMAKGTGIKQDTKIIKEMMAKSIDVIYFMDSFKVMDICEVLGYDMDKDMYYFNHLYKYVDETKDFIKCGEISKRLKKKIDKNI